MRNTSKSLITFAVAMACTLLAQHLGAQESAADYPKRPVKLIVPQGAGGMVDTVSRAIVQNMAERLGQAIVVENRPGASEALGAELAANSPPDGYTMFIGTQVSLVLNTIFRKNLPYNPTADFAPVSMLFTSPLYLVVHPSVPVQSVSQLVDFAKARPGQLTFASIGNGTTSHLAGEVFKSNMKLNILHVPYKSTPQSITDLVSGEVSMMIHSTSVLPHVRVGRLRALASMGPKRTPATPDLPTMAEAGAQGFERLSWYSLVTPDRVPKTIIEKLNREVVQSLNASTLRSKFAPLGIDFTPSKPEAVELRIKSDIPYWTGIAREAGISPK